MKEIEDATRLVEIIKESKWVDSSMIIVNCAPDYSSISSQIVNHKLSHLNDNELFEQILLEMPYPIMSQVWNRERIQFEKYEFYLQNWVSKYINPDCKYLFLEAAISHGKNLRHLNSLLKARTDPETYKFASLYVEDKSIFVPDYYVQKVDTEQKGSILFEWENSNNPNWNF